MGIWIRSQDKSFLLFLNGFCSSCKNEIIGFCTQNANEEEIYILGKYSSKEKAMKVLNTIQKHISNKNLIDLNIDSSLCNTYNVFQMPQDDEVYTND